MTQKTQDDTVVLPDSLAVIEQRAFSGCEKLSGITVSSSCQTIGDYAFSDCVSLHSICVKGDNTFCGERSIGYLYDSGYILNDCFVLDAPVDSVAAGYAEENGICLKSEILMGDTDDNGVVDIKDIVKMCRWMLGAGEMNNPCAADINNNGVPDISDFCMLKHMLVSSV
ncbi:MAG: leucine-rich repeat protein [Oscillospiraceae bacterium]|nr:leucine-rich repeat protein [Oscillospiraceae bacterium]